MNENMGYPIGINIGLSHCNGEYITIMNNDLIFIKGWFNPIIDLLHKDPAIGVAVPHLSYGSGVQHVGVFLEDRETIQAYGQRYMCKNKGKIAYLDRGVGTCMVMKKAVVEKVGGNDIWYGIGHYDDDDWSLRIRLAGFKIIAVGSSFVYHQGSKTFQKYYPDQSHYVEINKNKFCQKWGLKEDRIRANIYIDRRRIIEEIPYSKKEHYMPIDYKGYESHESHKPSGILWVADWTDKHSGWIEWINHLKQVTHHHEKCYVWVPSKYYSDEVSYHVYKNILTVMGEKANIIEVFQQDVNPLTLLKFVKRFSKVLPIKRDFINKYINYLFNDKKNFDFNEPL